MLDSVKFNPSSEIRLLRLVKDIPAEWELTEGIKLHKAEPFKAVSYTWGSETPTEDLHFSYKGSKYMVKFQRNLANLLQELPGHLRARCLGLSCVSSV
jgi:hypothetical protein